MVEAGLAFGVGDGERGGGEDDGGVVGEERFGEELRDVDGCGLKVGREGVEHRSCRFGASVAGGIAEVGGRAAFNPEDGVGVVGFEKELEMCANVGCALAQARGLFDFADAVELAFEANERVGRAEVRVAVSLEEVGAVGELHAARLGGSVLAVS